MASIKTIGTVAVIVGCFAIIYPRFMHPLFLRMLGMNSVPAKEEDSVYPPHMRGNGPVPRRPPPMQGDPRDIHQRMRQGPHPGMRAAAEMQKQQSPGGSGRGMMGIVLPMYAVGICVYLVYTLFKVFNKRGQYSDPYGTGSSRSRYEPSGGEQQPVDRLGFPRDMRGDQEEVQRYLQKKHQEKELEDLLLKLDDTRNVSDDEMRALQKRLEDTEAQMTRILAAMQAMQTRMTTTEPGTQETSTEGVETLGRAEEGTGNSASSNTEMKKADVSADSSPDTESFEMVKNRGSITPDASSSSRSDASSPFLIEPCDEAEEEQAAEGEQGEETTTETISQEVTEARAPSAESTVRHRKTGTVDED